ncbi:immunity protein Imm33 domain-containing protein [Huijunlia imazamoxiresistens]|uniref:immunity protein Imm33 domain-containing protein n=1 Tax=Huijunlia imazamoxiresistens TaxID=3127457 RepID=UPI003D76A24D
MCPTHGAKYSPVDPFQIIGLADDLSQVPFHGLRHPTDNSSGWYIWSGEYNNSDTFFKLHHIGRLMYFKPEVLKYLGRTPGYGFLIDDQGYEDVWFDESLLRISEG